MGTFFGGLCLNGQLSSDFYDERGELILRICCIVCFFIFRIFIGACCFFYCLFLKKSKKKRSPVGFVVTGVCWLVRLFFVERCLKKMFVLFVFG